MKGRYDDIIHLPHPTSPSRPRMERINRAAQFAPFAALTGYDEAVRETARETQRRRELDDDGLALLNARLHWLMAHAREMPEVSIVYFAPDDKKAGGAYLCASGPIRRVDEIGQEIVLADGTVLLMDRVLSIESDAFADMGE